MPNKSFKLARVFVIAVMYFSYTPTRVGMTIPMMLLPSQLIPVLISSVCFDPQEESKQEKGDE